MNIDNPTLKNTQVAIVGLGLMGGSLALALKDRVGRIVGVDSDRAVVRAAVKRRIVEQGTSDAREAFSMVGLTVLAIPVRQVITMIHLLPELAPRGMAIVDLGSTKVEVVREMSRLPETYSAIGGHPMTGKEKSGLDAAEPSLFQEKTFAICRTATTDSVLEGLVLEMVDAIGSHPLFIDATAHDQIVAATSHLPHVISGALMDLVSKEAAQDESWEWRLSASGFRDMARLAGSDPTMILDILLTNRRFVVPLLRRFGEKLGETADALEKKDIDGLRSWLESVWAGHDRYLSANKDCRPPR